MSQSPTGKGTWTRCPWCLTRFQRRRAGQEADTNRCKNYLLTIRLPEDWWEAFQKKGTAARVAQQKAQAQARVAHLTDKWAIYRLGYQAGYRAKRYRQRAAGAQAA